MRIKEIIIIMLPLNHFTDHLEPGSKSARLLIHLYLNKGLEKNGCFNPEEWTLLGNFQIHQNTNCRNVLGEDGTQVTPL